MRCKRMIVNLVRVHLKDTFSIRKLLIFSLSIIAFLILKLYLFIDFLNIIEQDANLLDWILYSIGGPIGNTRLLQGLFFLILLLLLTTFSRSIHEKNTFLYAILLTKSNSRFNWINSIFISQLIISIVSVLLTIILTLLVGIAFFEISAVSLYFETNTCIYPSYIVSFTIC